MTTKTKEETDRNQISSISSIFNQMKTMMDDFKHGLSDFIEKIVTKKLDEQDAISLHANPTSIDEVSGSNKINNNGDTGTPVQNNSDKGSHNGDTDTPVQNNRDKGSHNTDADQGSAVRGTPQ